VFVGNQQTSTRRGSNPLYTPHIPERRLSLHEFRKVGTDPTAKPDMAATIANPDFARDEQERKSTT
jgi:hypothetical protein